MGRKKKRANLRRAEEKKEAESILERPNTNDGIFVHKGRPEVVPDAEAVQDNRWILGAIQYLESLKASFHADPTVRFKGVDSKPQLTKEQIVLLQKAGLIMSKITLDKLLLEVARLEREGEQEHPALYWAFMAGVHLAMSGAQIDSFHLYKRHNSSSIGSRKGGGRNRKRTEARVNDREAYLEMAKDLRKRNHIRSASSILEEVGKKYEVTRQTVRNHLTDEDWEGLESTE